MMVLALKILLLAFEILSFSVRNSTFSLGNVSQGKTLGNLAFSMQNLAMENSFLAWETVLL